MMPTACLLRLALNCSPAMTPAIAGNGWQKGCPRSRPWSQCKHCTIPTSLLFEASSLLVAKGGVSVRLSLQLVVSARKCDVLEHVGKGPRARDAIIAKLVQVLQSSVEGFRCHLVTACHERQRFGRCEHVEISRVGGP